MQSNGLTLLKIPYSPQSWQNEFHQNNARFRILACGRRSGKTTAAVNEAIKQALYKKESVVWIVAPTHDQVNKPWELFWKFIPKELVRKENKSTRTIELINGSVIRFESTDLPDNLRGEGLDFLVIDEAAEVSQYAWQNVLRPSLSDKLGKAVFISTPKGHNWFYEMWIKGQTEENHKSWKLPTSVNQFIISSEIEDAKKTLPEMVFKQEYEAEFLEDLGSVFRGVNECIRNYNLPIQPEQTERYTMGVDLAKYIDFTVITILDEENKLVYFDRFQQLDWVFQKKMIQQVAEIYKANVIIDSTGLGDPIFDDLARTGMNVLSYKITTQSKKELIENLSLLIQQQKIAFPDIPILINELKIFGYKQLERGFQYSAPEGYHDDCVISLALAAIKSGYHKATFKIGGVKRY